MLGPALCLRDLPSMSTRVLFLTAPSVGAPWLGDLPQAAQIPRGSAPNGVSFVTNPTTTSSAWRGIGPLSTSGGAASPSLCRWAGGPRAVHLTFSIREMGPSSRSLVGLV